MKIKLNFPERLALIDLLPPNDNFTNLCLRDEVIKRIKFSASEVAEIRKKTTKKKFVKSTEFDENEYQFSEIETIYVKENLRNLSDKKQLHFSCKSIYSKFFN